MTVLRMCALEDCSEQVSEDELVCKPHQQVANEAYQMVLAAWDEYRDATRADKPFDVRRRRLSEVFEQVRLMEGQL